MGFLAIEGTDPEVKKKPEALKEVSYHGNTYHIAREGTAEILDLQTSKSAKSLKDGLRSQSVFYNPIQQYNRDLSVLAIKAFGEDLAVIRRARYERRVEHFAKGGQRGKKRKRPEDGPIRDVDGSAISEQRNQTDLPVNEGDCRPDSEEVGPDIAHGAPLSNSGAVPSRIGGLNNDPPDLHGKINGQDTNGETARTGPSEPGNGDKAPYMTASFRILDALSATGLRALRYAKEIPMATSITANDLSPSATASIRLNVDHNQLSGKITPNTSNAIEHMHHTAAAGFGGSRHYHVIDLDPYGTAAPFLDSAVQAIADGGLLCVTCTDAGVFASLGYLEKTYSQYGGLPLKGVHAHEGGLRLILHAIATSAARYGLAIEPLLSLSIDFYARVFVRVHRSPAEVKFLASKTMVVYNCDVGCGAWSIQHLARVKEKRAKNGDVFYNFTSALVPSTDTHCEHCGFRTHLAGPMWGGPLHNPRFIQRVLDMLPNLDREIYGTVPRIEGMLSIAMQESLEDPDASRSTSDRPIPPTNPVTRSHHPFFFTPSTLSRVIHCVSPSDAAVRGALMNLGYRTTRSHTKAGSICTDAPWSVVWEVMREWVRQNSPVKAKLYKKNTAGRGIMQKDRSRIKLMEAKQKLRDALEDPDVMDLDDLEKKVEAALCKVPGTAAHEAPRDGHKVDLGMDFIEISGADEWENVDGEAHKVLALPKESEKHGKREEKREDDVAADRKRPEPHPSTLEIVFDEMLGKEPPGKRMVKYQQNPRSDWGPMNRAKGDH